MRQKYGQHFLTDANIIVQIVDAALLLRAANVVEIGPGKGALTAELISHGVTNFTAVEVDPEMVSFLQAHLPAAGVQIIAQNFLEFDLNLLPTVPTTFISNLPYLYAAEILDKVLAWPHFETAVFMFQKEHAQKIRAQAGDGFYGPLSIFSQLRARASLICKVGRGCFTPPPQVESAVLAFEKITPPNVPWEKLRRVVTSAFLHRRKTLLNALVLAGYDKDKISAALEKLFLPLTVRPEQISPDGYVQLTLLL
ncbi:MAG: 16S rRNA (adenine(1518)-N(6)/adenine(1519)-N(6))-dimethyltransferase RsmA [Elusimicrobiaceae bacterium]|nr:16S rRNA (adenine(1518)-N(6)/adenine(1519)-N(6))-dimethyltransferase RsmA [Elusimicrobiaceae bacterium]